MWEHRRLVVVHAFIGEVVVNHLNELAKFLPSTKHAFCHLRRKQHSWLRRQSWKVLLQLFVALGTT